MPEPWFDPMWAWLPGTVLGCGLGLWGSLVGVLAPRGKARGLVFGTFWFGLALSAVLLVAGVVALIAGQPYAIWYGLGLAGLLGSVLLPCLLPTVVRRYREAEDRRLHAQDLT